MTILLGPVTFEGGTITPYSATGTFVNSTTQAHSPTHSAGFSMNTGGANYGRAGYTTVATGVRVFHGAWYWLPSFPSTTATICFLEHTAFGGTANLQVDGAGTIALADSTGAVVVTGPTIGTSTWVNIEFSARVPVAGSTDTYQLVVNSTSYGVASGNTGTNQMNQSRTGLTNGASTGITTGYVDDVQINDDTGASNNSWPSGFGASSLHTMLLLGVGA